MFDIKSTIILTTPEALEAFLSSRSQQANETSAAPLTAKEIINTATLCERLDITKPTIITWRKKGKIPFLKIGSAIRYDWVEVVKALENKKAR
jgi:excisionase family DNA binding protein